MGAEGHQSVGNIRTPHEWDFLVRESSRGVRTGKMDRTGHRANSEITQKRYGATQEGFKGSQEEGRAPSGAEGEEITSLELRGYIYPVYTGKRGANEF